MNDTAVTQDFVGRKSPRQIYKEEKQKTMEARETK